MDKSVISSEMLYGEHIKSSTVYDMINLTVHFVMAGDGSHIYFQHI